MTKKRLIPPRDRILRAAAEVFAEHGYDAASIGTIAARARVNKAMLYYYIGDKSELFAEVMRTFIAAVQAEVAQALAGISEPTARIRAIPLALSSVAERIPVFPQIMFRELACGGEHIPDEALDSIARIAALTAEAIAEGRKRKLFRAVDPILTHLLLVGSVIFMANARRLAPRMLKRASFPGVNEPSPRGMAGFVTDIVLNGIAARSPRGETP